MTVCPHCGSALPSSDDAFCAICREPLDEPVVQRAAATTTTPPVDAPCPETVEDFHGYALECLLQGTSPQEIRSKMTEMGCPASEADDILQAAQDLRRDNEIRAKVTPWALDKEYMCKRFPEMRWVESVPPMNMFNGFGFNLLGARDRDPQTNTFVTTVYLCVLFIPVFAFGSYRVAEISDRTAYLIVGHVSNSSWRFYGRVPMSWFLKSWNLLVFTAVVGFVIFTW